MPCGWPSCLAHGLIRSSFVPDTQTQEMRGLLRTRKQLIREQSSHMLRVQKTLEDANIKLDSVLSDLMGQSGRAMIEALIAGETNPAKLASLANRRVRASHEELREALRGRVTKNHRFLLRLHLNQIDALDAAIATVDEQVEGILEPFQIAVELVMSVPGIKNLSAQVIISEIGTDMSRFPSDQHLISWAGICPRNDESAGKRRSNRLRKGAPWLKTTLVQCAWAAVKKKGRRYVRGRPRRGGPPRRAIKSTRVARMGRAEPQRTRGGPWETIVKFSSGLIRQRRSTPLPLPMPVVMGRHGILARSIAHRRRLSACSRSWQ